MKHFTMADLLGGALMLAVGATFSIVALNNYPMGSAIAPGPGIFPFAVGAITGLIGLAIIARAFIQREDIKIQVTPRAVLSVLVAIAAFAFLIGRVGLIATLFVTVLIAATGSRDSRPLPALGVAFATAFGGWLIFIQALGLPLIAFKAPF